MSTSMDNDEKKESNNQEAADESSVDTETLEFLEQIELAITEARSSSKILMVLCDSDRSTSESGPSSGENIDLLWQDASIMHLLSSYAVCLRILPNSSGFNHFATIYPVFVVPTVYFINSNNGAALRALWGKDISHESLMAAIDDCLKCLEKDKFAQTIQIESQASSTNDNNNNGARRERRESMNSSYDGVRFRMREVNARYRLANSNEAMEASDVDSASLTQSPRHAQDAQDAQDARNPNMASMTSSARNNENFAANGANGANAGNSASSASSANTGNSANDEFGSISIREMTPLASYSSVSSTSATSFASNTTNSNIPKTSKSVKNVKNVKKVSKAQQKLAEIRARAAKQKETYQSELNQNEHESKSKQNTNKVEKLQGPPDQPQPQPSAPTESSEKSGFKRSAPSAPRVPKASKSSKSPNLPKLRKIESLADAVPVESPVASEDVAVTQQDKFVETPPNQVRRRKGKGCRSQTRSETRSEGSDSRGKRARFAFHLDSGSMQSDSGRECDFYQSFDYNDTLVKIVKFVEKETDISDFTLVSKFPSMRINSFDVLKNSEVSDDTDSVISVGSSAASVPTDASALAEQRKMCDKTLLELGLVPSCRMFVLPKWKGNVRNGNTDDSGGFVALMWMYIVMFVSACSGGLTDAASFAMNGINAGLEWINKQLFAGKVKKSRERTRNASSSERLPLKRKTNGSKKKRGGIHRLEHLEKDDDKNKYWNGNSTMFGGDDK